jgi:glycosyltransferase involved in cell wall biosynthesis
MVMNQQAQISVVMPVHNGAPFLNESIDSILNQSFSNFEFVILDDASTDDSLKILRDWEERDCRIRLHKVEDKLGLAGSSNFIVSQAIAPLIARMDADDISKPDRLRRQWEVMQSDSDVVAVGTLFDGIDVDGELTRPRDRWRLVRRSSYIPFPHGSAMFRRATFDAVGGYREHFAGGEDQDIFLRMRQHGLVVTLSDVLYRFRYHSFNSSLQSGERGVKAVIDRHSGNGHDLAALYLLGAMRLWAGERPEVLRHMLAKKSWPWNLGTMTAIAASAWGSISPATLRFSLRSLIRVRDLLAGIVVKDGRAYEWRFK